MGRQGIASETSRMRHFAGVLLGASILGALDWFGPDPPPSALLMGAAGYGGWWVRRYRCSKRAWRDCGKRPG